MADPPAPPGIDPESLAAEFTRQAARGVPLPAGRPLQVTLIPGGLSNLTYLVTGPGEVDGVIVRRGPLGHVLPTAHDMSREFRVLTALSGTPVPAPRPLYQWPHPEPMGAPYYVMERLPGVVLRRPEDLAALPPAIAEAIADRLVDALVSLHAVDPTAVGLSGADRGSDYLPRQLARWARQAEGNRTRDLPDLAELADRLAASTPATREVGIVHGDYRLDNVLVTLPGVTDAAGADAAEAGVAVSGILDWEMSTVGDVLTDVGMLWLYWQGVAGIGITPAPGAMPGFPDIAHLCRRYATRTGRDVTDLGWYVAFSFYKLAVIAEGIHARYQRGATVGAGFERVGQVVPVLLTRGLAHLP